MHAKAELPSSILVHIWMIKKENRGVPTVYRSGATRRGELGAGCCAALVCARRFTPVMALPLQPCCVLHSSSKFARHVQAYDGECPPVLAFLASRLWLTVHVDAHELAPIALRHFLRHYSSLGVWPNRTRVLSRGKDATSVDHVVMRVALSAGLPSSNVESVAAPPSPNEALRPLSASLDTWHIYADVDDLYDYPCEIATDVVRHHVSLVMGNEWDQSALEPSRSCEQLPPPPEHHTLPPPP